MLATASGQLHPLVDRPGTVAEIAECSRATGSRANVCYRAPMIYGLQKILPGYWTVTVPFMSSWPVMRHLYS